MKEKATRVRRAPINGQRNVLNVKGKEEGFHYRIVNDTDDRVQEFTDRGYEVVSGDKTVTIGDKRVAVPSDEGTVKYISVGGGQKAVLMRIPDEWYKEDQAVKQKDVDEVEAAIKQNALGTSDYGKFEISRK